jgi:hypothetical protein
MTAPGLPDNNVPEATAEQPSSRELADMGPRTVVAVTVADTTDVDTSNRLRRALRILLAARRRDDGGDEHIENN